MRDQRLPKLEALPPDEFAYTILTGVFFYLYGFDRNRDIVLADLAKAKVSMHMDAFTATKLAYELLSERSGEAGEIGKLAKWNDDRILHWLSEVEYRLPQSIVPTVKEDPHINSEFDRLMTSNW